MRKQPLVVIAAMLIVPAAYSAEYLDKQQFESQIVGKSISTTTSKGVPITMIYKSGGPGELQQQGKKKAKFSWSFKEDVVCLKIGKFQECNKVTMAGPSSANFVDAKTGKLNNTYALK